MSLFEDTTCGLILYSFNGLHYTKFKKIQSVQIINIFFLGPKAPGSKLGPLVKPMTGGPVKAESIVSPFKMESVAAQAKREATGPRPEAHRLGFAKSRSPPKPLSMVPSAGAAGSYHKKTMSLVSYSSEDSDSDADL